MKYYSGIDEAGLGPILGPYCATSTTFKSKGPLKELLTDIPKSIFYVDDSKKVYQGKNGLLKLEENVLSFYYILTGKIPSSINEFIPSLNSDWNMDQNIALPIKSNSELIYQKANKILNVLNDKNIELVDIKRTAITPYNFNALITTFDNKSTVCQKIIEPLIVSTIKDGENNIVIDKQGGRKFYKEYLDSILNVDVKVISEVDNHSHYFYNNTDFHFKAKADSLHFSVALASMFSKYMRELAMISFNNYWRNIVPEIKPTAGYYTDGIRFINDLKQSKALPKDLDILIRKK